MMEMYKKVLYTLRGVCICIEHEEAIDRCLMFMCNIMRKGRLLENIQLGGQKMATTFYEGRGLKSISKELNLEYMYI